MELHRTGKRPDWLKRPRRDYSWFQRTARQTNGIVTPGNVITIVGLVVTLCGLWLLTDARFGGAVIALLVGRLCDVADGWVAHHTGTKSPTGELLDAGCDKIATILGLVALGVADIAPWWILAVVAVPQIVTSVVSGLALRRKHRLHPSPIGKIGMVFAWTGFAGLVFAAWVDTGLWHAAFLAAGYASLTAAVVLSSYALVHYVQQFNRKTKP